MFNFHKKKHHDQAVSAAIGIPKQLNNDHTQSLYSTSSNKILYPKSYSTTKKQDQSSMNISPSPVGISEPTPRRYQVNAPTSFQSDTPASMNRKRSSLNDLLLNEQHTTTNSSHPNLSGASPFIHQQQYLSSQTQQPHTGSKISYGTAIRPTQSQALLPQQQAQTQLEQPVLKRVWVKKVSHTATTINVGPSDIVDDLKYMIANKFPTTLAVEFDPSDLVIKLQVPQDYIGPAKLLRSATSNSYEDNTLTLHHELPILSGNNIFGSQNPRTSDDVYNSMPLSGGRPHVTNFSGEITRSVTPASPEPLAANRSSLVNKDQLESTWKSNNARMVILQPDITVWSVLDKYFPSGMQMSDALIIDTNEPHKEDATKPEFRPKSNISFQSQLTRTRSDQNDMTTLNFPNPVHPSINNKIAILGEQKVPKPRFKSMNLQENPVPQSAAVILFSKDCQDEKDNQNKVTTVPPSPSAKQSDNEPPPMQLSNLPTNSSSSSDSHKKINLRVDVAGDGESVRPPNSNSTLIAAPTPRSDTTLTPKNPISKTKIEAKAKDKKLGLSRILVNINVLVVEDNLVNQKIMARHLKSCGVQFKIASTGQEALEIWKEGGFHLCFMDIQLPVMSGIEVTKEIRRLERLNNIGSIYSYDELPHTSNKPEDTLDLSLFRSPIIIVALTASSGATDQQNALAAGCNDYLTKPVQLKWLKNKLTEWGYMQALINFDYFKLENRN